MPAILFNQTPSVEPQHSSKPTVTLATQSQTASSQDLPSAADCAAHLHLLEAFVTLNDTVHDLAVNAGLGPDRAWGSFCNRAVARFEEWSARGPADRMAMPPVDVLMAWHALMLHPKAYARFVELGGKLGLDGMDWSRISTSAVPDIDIDSLTSAHTGIFTLRSSAGTSLFTYPLAAAIRRQVSFSLKMTRHAWLRSPALASTLGRARARYARFFRLIAAHPRTVMVPTLDVDLVWHTHQLAPARYLAHSKRAAGRLVDHDDEIEDATLGALSADMQTLWADAFGEAYHVCLCWACEGGRAGVDAGVVAEALRGELPCADLAFPRCDDCGAHPESCCPEVEGAAGCGSGCGGGCGGEGGCGSCGAMR
ncbi:Glycine-rich domain-containing protein 1 [Colletotrichum tanaceti]|uniref:Glycine-rich domain-containing protein 1 n=1 Tax=Colletotrichum tanaceti TaxID=1306861 RepID=A0A4U6X7L6_9PEZI|nr:Glycine-rich domain-containing protein 1 [Colletotrichum tanaceti]